MDITARFGLFSHPLRLLLSLVSVTLAAMLLSCGGSPSNSNNNGNGGPGDINAVNHIVYMLQENRSFDNYFGKLNDYRVSKGLGADVDGLSSSSSNPSYDRSTT